MTTGVRDYEYYEARAKDVKLGDITSNTWNASILARLRDNDPSLTSVYIDPHIMDTAFIVSEGDDLGWLGYFVGKNEQLEGLSISNFPNNFNLKNIDEFLRGLGRNRSIQNLHIGLSLGESFQGLVPFLSNNSSLRDLAITGFQIGLQCARSIALLLGQQSSFKCFYFDDVGLDDEGLVKIASALRKQPQLEELYLCCNDIGRDGCVALGEGLRNPYLSTLDIGHNNIDDEGLCALVAGLMNCHNLTSLSLYRNEFITESGLRSLSTLFQSDHCRLEHLDLEDMNIDDDGAAVLVTGLTSLMKLKKLNLSRNRIGDLGLAGGLVNCCNIEELDLSSNMLSISASRDLGTLMQRAPRLKSLILADNAITDEGLQCLVDGMTQHCSLTALCLSQNSITAVGLRSLARFLRSDNCCLLQLGILDIDFGDEGAVALADGLIGNKSLQFLQIDSNITARGWAALSRLLCDTSSVNHTYLSNHTIIEIGGYEFMSSLGIRPDFVEYLKLNRELSRHSTAICKILRSHPDIDMEPLFRWKLKCLPLVVSLLRQVGTCLYLFNFLKESTWSIECRQLSAVYKFVRGIPLLTVEGYRSQKMTDSGLKSKKRKFDHMLTW